MIAAMMLGLFVGLLALRTPVEIAVGIAAMAGVIAVGHPLDVVARTMVGSVDNFILIAVPFFILAGNLMNAGGMTTKIFEFARALTGHMRGGLAQVNVAGSMIFAGMSGAAVADLAALGTIEVKVMREHGYSVPMAAAISLASCTIGPIIPPSIVLVIYGMMTDVSIGRLFLGGIIPGLLIGAVLMAFIYFYARYRPQFFGSRELFVWSRVWSTLWAAKLELLSPVVIIGLLLTGVATPTEVGVFATLYALLIGLINRELTWAAFAASLASTLATTAIIMYLIAVSSVLGDIVVQERTAHHLTAMVGAITTDPVAALMLINVFLLIVGMLIDSTPALIICSTILFPIITSLGIDPVHFGIVICFNLIIGIITPPMGIGLYVAARIAFIPVEDVLRAVLPFLIPLLVSLLVISAIPGLSTWLPNLVFGPAPGR